MVMVSNGQNILFFLYLLKGLRRICCPDISRSIDGKNYSVYIVVGSHITMVARKLIPN